MITEAIMKHLCGPFWFASRERFLHPGLYYCNGKSNRRIVPLPKPYQPPELIEFAEQSVVIAKDQPEYRPLPAHRHANDPNGKITFCWKLNWRDRLKVLHTGKLWHQVWTFNQPLQPQLMLTDKPEMVVKSILLIG